MFHYCGMCNDIILEPRCQSSIVVACLGVIHDKLGIIDRYGVQEGVEIPHTLVSAKRTFAVPLLNTLNSKVTLKAGSFINELKFDVAGLHTDVDKKKKKKKNRCFTTNNPPFQVFNADIVPKLDISKEILVDSNLPPINQQELLWLIHRYNDIFSADLKEKLACTANKPHHSSAT